MTNHQRTCGCKPCLVGKNHDNSKRREDNEPDEGSGQTNEGIWSVEVGLKKPALTVKLSNKWVRDQKSILLAIESRIEVYSDDLRNVAVRQRHSERRPSAEHSSSRVSERDFVDYIPPTEKKTHPTRQCIICCSKIDKSKQCRASGSNGASSWSPNQKKEERRKANDGMCDSCGECLLGPKDFWEKGA
ncbi:hypothetical protein TNCV_3736891 [Trichonephila clavipes]|nr:hypothetical protein TNCV_3736891 [Trichonephila clavipes]